jgi:uncharacterized protein (UPF0332 family)
VITEDVKALAQHRLEQADESIAAALFLYQKVILRRPVNSAYYVMFYAVMALLAIKKKETSNHGSAIGLFDREFVKKNISTHLTHSEPICSDVSG